VVAKKATKRRSHTDRLRIFLDAPEGIIGHRTGEFGQIVVVKQGQELLMVFCPNGVPVSTEALSGVMARVDLTDPLKLKGIYTQAMMCCLAFSPDPSRAYVMGAGGGRIPTALTGFSEGVTVSGAELDPVVMEVSREFFGFEQDPRLEIVCAEGRTDLAAQSNDRFDHIYLDCFASDGRVPHALSTVEFFAMCATKLAETGVACTNLVDTDPRFSSQVDGFLTVFSDVWRFEFKGTHVLFGRKQGGVLHQDLMDRAAVLKSRLSFGFDLPHHIASLQPVPVPVLRVLRPLRDAEP
jgi:spermidine synthase